MIKQKLENHHRLVTSPFIKRIMEEKQEYFLRVDPLAQRRFLVQTSPNVEHLLQFFASTNSVQALLDKTDRHEHNERIADIEELIYTGFISKVEGLTLDRPSVELELTNRCNANCLMCPRKKLRKLGDMPQSVFMATLRFLSTNKISGLILSGIGDASLLPDLELRIGEIHSMLATPARIAMVSNGFLLDPDRLSRLRKAGLGLLQWSFHSSREDVFNKIFGVKKYTVAKRNLENCLKEHAEVMSVNIVVMNENTSHLSELTSWLVSCGISKERICFIPLFNRGDIVNIHKAAIPPSIAKGRCTYLRQSLFIAWNGDLLPCSNDISGEHCYGNVLNSSPEELLQHWQQTLLGDPPAFPICGRCDYHTRDTLDTAWFNLVRDCELAP